MVSVDVLLINAVEMFNSKNKHDDKYHWKSAELLQLDVFYDGGEDYHTTARRVLRQA